MQNVHYKKQQQLHLNRKNPYMAVTKRGLLQFTLIDIVNKNCLSQMAICYPLVS